MARQLKMFLGGRSFLILRLFKNLRIAIGLVVVSLLSGTVGYVVLEDYSWVDAAYMTVITVSTVGYGEVNPLSENGRIFTSVLIITNLGVFFYAISTVTSFFLEGDARTVLAEYRMDKALDQLKDHVVVVGYGRNGRQVVQEFQHEGQEFVVIENDPITIEHIEKETAFICVKGDATTDEIMEKARLDKACALITTLPKDADNVFVVLTAHEINPRLHIIARASNESSESKLLKAGCDHVIMPERLGGSHMASIVMKPEVMEFIGIIASASHTGFYFELISYNNLLHVYRGKQIAELKLRNNTGANIVGLQRADGEYIVNPSPDTSLTEGTKLIILGNREQAREGYKYLTGGYRPTARG